jgi:hypothetical protein
MTNKPAQHIALNERRGSAILIVVGTLALIAVFAAIYISVGQGDQRVARSIQNKQSIEDNADLFAIHILNVLRDDRLDMNVKHSGLGAGDFFTELEITDAPYVDWLTRSESDDEYELFNPSGRSFLAGNAAISDYRVASDPWLASTTPTYLGDPGQPANGDDQRPFASLIPGDADLYIANRYSSGFLDNRDWYQISNVAPDGRFVNLFNLRANQAQSNGFGDTDVGGFDSEPGYGTFNRADGTVVRRMSEYLSLWKPDRDDPNARIQTMVPENEGVWIPGRNAPEMLNFNGDDVKNVPAVWTMYQRFMFMPINQPFLTVNRNNQISTWADPDYAPYQYADADGDGMADSRWVELTLARETQSGSSNQRDDIERLYDAGRARLFAAVRVVDLSSMVNVNTALDQLAEPDPEMGGSYGATPADVDLRRLLSLTDVANNYSIASFGGLSPKFFHRPTMSSNTVGGNNTDEVSDDDYFKYSSRAFDDPMFVNRKSIQPHTNALSIGRFAYDAIKRGIEFGETLDSRYYAWPPEFAELSGDTAMPTDSSDLDDDFNAESSDLYNIADSNFLKYRLNQFHEDPISQAGAPMTVRERSDWFRGIGRLNPFGRDQLNTNASYDVNASLYNEDDLYELLAFHGLNDPSTVSRLEKSAMGRMPSIADQNQRALSPLLSNRPLELDRSRHGITEGGLTGFMGYTIAHPETDRYIAGRIAKESMAFFATSPRKLLTTVSGASHLLPGTAVNTNNTALTDSEVAQPLEELLSSPSLLFGAYSRALASELNPSKVSPLSIDDIYISDPSNARDESTATLFYGHRGPELALRIAAHAAVNMADLYDNDQEPTAATLVLHDSVRDDFLEGAQGDYDGESTTVTEYAHYAGRATDNVFDPGETNVPTTSFPAMQDHRYAVNVFGIEPMPFLTEVASMYVYTDAPGAPVAAGNPGDDFGIQYPRNIGGFFTIPVVNEEITIDGSVSDGNGDLMMQVLAFQLTNPWHESITIGGNGQMGWVEQNGNVSGSQLEFDYYIEYGGRFFKLGEFIEYNPADDRYGYDSEPNPPSLDSPITSANPEFQYQGTTIPAGESRVFYAIAHGRFDAEDGSSDLDSKWLSQVGSFTDDGEPWTGPAEEWINRQFRTESGNRPMHIHQFDPRTGELVEEDGFHDLLSEASPIADPVFNDADREHDYSQARLWRKIRGSLEEQVSGGGPVTLGAISENLIQNDLLVDRLDMEGTDRLDRPLAAGDNEVEGSVSYNPDLFTEADSSATGVRNDNFGMSIVRWASYRRGDNNDATPETLDHDQGQIGAWMLASRSQPTFNTVFSKDLYDDGGTLTISDFRTGSVADLEDPSNNAPILPDYEVHETFADLFDLFSTQAVIQSIVREPETKYELSTLNPAMQIDGIDMTMRFPALHLADNSVGEILHGDDSDLRPELLPSANGFNESPRLADLLLAWGIGPTYTPDPDRVAGDVSYENEDARRWITLPEALAIGLGYETFTEGQYQATEAIAENIWIESISTDDELFDNGHLSLDNFVAYFNTDTSEDPPEFNTGFDIRRGSGIPLALGVLDQARPIDTIDPEFDLLTNPTFGLININTAPVEVLRLLPGLSPSLTSYYPNVAAIATEDEWWARQNTALDLPDLTTPNDRVSPTGVPTNVTPDVAALLVAYRDRLHAHPRFASRRTDTDTEANQLRYSPADPQSVAENMLTEFPGAEEMPPAMMDHRDRATIAGINGLRATPGFASMGEILMATIDIDARGEVGDWSHKSNHFQLDIQQLGYDEKNLDGVSDTEIAMDPQIFSGNTNGSTTDDYAERLALANSILNTISVRSDYFAVWFVVHAYEESDVTNLQPEDPLVPSIAKRYVMVVDRTNVKDPGDTPKVVFLKEVPM